MSRIGDKRLTDFEYNRSSHTLDHGQMSIPCSKRGKIGAKIKNIFSSAVKVKDCKGQTVYIKKKSIKALIDSENIREISSILGAAPKLHKVFAKDCFVESTKILLDNYIKKNPNTTKEGFLKWVKRQDLTSSLLFREVLTRRHEAWKEIFEDVDCPFPIVAGIMSLYDGKQITLSTKSHMGLLETVYISQVYSSISLKKVILNAYLEGSGVWEEAKDFQIADISQYESLRDLVWNENVLKLAKSADVSPEDKLLVATINDLLKEIKSMRSAKENFDRFARTNDLLKEIESMRSAKENSDQFQKELYVIMEYIKDKYRSIDFVDLNDDKSISVEELSPPFIETKRHEVSNLPNL